jgi:hypothetical protein
MTVNQAKLVNANANTFEFGEVFTVSKPIGAANLERFAVAA